MGSDYIFEILEIEPTYDTKKLKKAYANLVKKYHPEEYPEKWQEIRAAYKTALGLAKKEEGTDGHVKMPEPVMEDLPQPSKENQFETVMKSGRMEISPRSVMKSERIEIPKKSSEESNEMDSMFDHIEALSKEQQQQNEEVFKRELQEVMDAFREISDKKSLDIKEWEAFFYQETRLPYLCTREFLEKLGDCFSNRKIDAEMYQFLKEQLAVIAKYNRDRGIVLKGIGILNPVDYAEQKIYTAYAGKSQAGSGNGFGTGKRTNRKAVWVIMIIVSIIIRSNFRHAGNAQEPPKIEDIPITVIENTENDGNVRRSHMPIIPDKIRIGDSREVMIEAFGEPDEIQESQENPGYEEAVYSSLGFGGGLVVVIENDVITDIYVEHMVEDAAFDTYPAGDSK